MMTLEVGHSNGPCQTGGSQGALPSSGSHPYKQSSGLRLRVGVAIEGPPFCDVFYHLMAVANTQICLL